MLEAGETARPAELLQRESSRSTRARCGPRSAPQQRLRALRIAFPRDYPAGEKIPAQTLGDRVAWIVVEGELEQDGHLRGPGSLIYPEALLTDRPLPDKDGLAIAQTEVRALALRNDDFRELCDEDPELGEVLLGSLASEIAVRRPHRRTGKIVVQSDTDDGRRTTDPGMETQPEIAIGRASDRGHGAGVPRAAPAARVDGPTPTSVSEVDDGRRSSGVRSSTGPR